MRDEGAYVVHLDNELLIKKSFIDIQNVFSDLSDRVDTDLFINKIIKYADSFIVVNGSGDMVSYAAMYTNDLNSKMAYITLIGCKKAYQHCGYGTLMFNYLEQYARNKGMKRLRLEVKKDNEDAISFYRKQEMEIFEMTSYGFYMQKNIKEKDSYGICRCNSPGL